MYLYNLFIRTRVPSGVFRSLGAWVSWVGCGLRVCLQSRKKGVKHVSRTKPSARLHATCWKNGNTCMCHPCGAPVRCLTRRSPSLLGLAAALACAVRAITSSLLVAPVPTESRSISAAAQITARVASRSHWVSKLGVVHLSCDIDAALIDISSKRRSDSIAIRPYGS